MNHHHPVDTLSRSLRDLRISVTDQCNMRCQYCMPAEVFGPDYPFLKRSEQLDFDEIERLVDITLCMGVDKIRLTGGEPLLRRGLPQLVHRIASKGGIRDLALTTNGLLLAKEAKKLKASGLHRINLSLDALSPEVFHTLGGGFGSPEQVANGLDACHSVGLPVKINTTLKKGINERELLPILKFGMKRDIEVRLIEYMDVGCSNGWERGEVVTEASMLEQVRACFGNVRELPSDPSAVARSYEIETSSYRFGIIASVTRPFCGGCVRARLSSDGKLFTCLFASSGHDLKPLLRGGKTDEELRDILCSIWLKRSDRYSEIREALDNPPRRRIEMSYIGG